MRGHRNRPYTHKAYHAIHTTVIMLGADISDPNTSDLNGPGNEATLHYITVLFMLTVKLANGGFH